MTRQKRACLRSRFGDKDKSHGWLWRQILTLCDDLDETETTLEMLFKRMDQTRTASDAAYALLCRRDGPCPRCNGVGQVEIDVPEGSTAGGWTKCPECKP